MARARSGRDDRTGLIVCEMGMHDDAAPLRRVLFWSGSTHFPKPMDFGETRFIPEWQLPPATEAS